MPYTPTNFSTTAVINADTLFQNYDDEVQVLMSDIGNYLTEEMVKVYTETETIVTDGIKVNSVETIEDLATQDGVVFPTIIVKDVNRGGTFVWSATGTANGGTVFAGATGFWNRQYSGAVNVKWFGAKGDGVTDDTAAFNTVASIQSFISVPNGNFRLNGITIDVPLYFSPGASITVNSGETITISNSIDSPKQYIFKGDGDYVLGHDADSGEDSREVHASWFGAFTSPTHGADQAPMINKAFASMGNGRESIVHFDIGNYNISSQIQVTRGGWVKGAGTRRTVFKLDTDGFDVFTTLEQACKFTEIQFELHTSILADRVSPYITLEHNDCVIKNVALTIGKKGIIVNGNGAIIDDVFSLYSGNHGADSSMIEINGSNTNVRNIKNNSSTTGNESVINIGLNATGTISGITIENIQTISPSKTVFITGDYNKSRIRIDGINYNGYAGTNPDNIIHVKAAVSASIDKVIISNIIGSPYSTGCILIENVGVGTIQDISINNIEFQSTNGIELRETSGTIKEIYIGAGVDVSDCTNPLVKVGYPSEIKIAPTAIYPNVNPSYSFDTTIADDGFYEVDLGVDIFAGSVIVNAGYANYGIYSIRAANSPGNILITGSANMVASIGTPTGTTGTDGKITLFTQDNGKIYVENRSGTLQRTTITINTGISQ